MSGGFFEYIQRNWDLTESPNDIQNFIDNNPNTFSEKTINKFKKGKRIIQEAIVYLERIDYLLSSDDGEEEFHKRLKDDLFSIKKGEI